jgi:hypothetical protein
MDKVIFELFLWKVGNKTFSLQIIVSKNDICGWNDWYVIEFKLGDRCISKYRGRRFTSFFDAEWRAFSNVLSNHHKALRAWKNFHCDKIDIVGLRVILVK